MEMPFLKNSGRFFESACRAARVLFYRAARSLFVRLIEPKSEQEDERRREYLLNIILTISIGFLFILLLIIVIDWIRIPANYGGVHPLVFAIITLFCCSLFVLSKKGHFDAASFALVAFFLLGAIYSGWAFGESLPATLLTNALVIVTAAILLGSRLGIMTTALVVSLMFALGMHEQAVIGVPDWHSQAISISDIIGYAIMFLFISFISWLSNREIEKSLVRARHSEKMLEEERNLLERKVSERTEELLSAQQEKERELEHTAQFGRLSRGLIHDLMNPLASISLYIDGLAKGQGSPEESKEMLRKTVAASGRMRSFISSVQHTSQTAVKEKYVSVSEELSTVKDLLAYKARMANVSISIDQCDPVVLAVEPVRLNQLLLNLISNSVDAFSADTKKNSRSSQEIHISGVEKDGCLTLNISDNGCGIPKEYLDQMFRKSFTTKATGTGLGLSTSKSIVERELNGSIKIESDEGIGTVCTITIPTQSNVKSNTSSSDQEEFHYPARSK